jgi:copper chaperone CopZ
MKIIQSFFLAVILLAAITNISYAQTAIANQQEDAVKTTTIKVKGVTCSVDVKIISTHLEELKGINACQVAKQGPTTTFNVEYNTSMITEKEIYAAIEETGGCEDPDARPYKVKR